MRRTPPGLECAILLHQHGVGAFGHRGTCKDPNRLTASSGPVERVAGRRPSGDRHNGVTIRDQIAVSDRVAINRAVVMRRQVHSRDDVARQNPAGGRRQRHRLGLDDRHNARFDFGERGRDGYQGSAEGETIVTQLGHR